MKDDLGVDEMGVDEKGCRRSGMTPYNSTIITSTKTRRWRMDDNITIFQARAEETNSLTIVVPVKDNN